jgi:hypothetical protein
VHKDALCGGVLAKARHQHTLYLGGETRCSIAQPRKIPGFA